MDKEILMTPSQFVEAFEQLKKSAKGRLIVGVYPDSCGGCRHMELDDCPIRVESRKEGLGCSEFKRSK